MTVIINGSNTPTAGGVTYGDGTQYATTTAGTSGQVLISAGSSAPTWGTASAATTATNLAGGAQGSVPYQSASGTTSMLAAGTNGQVLTSAGAGANPTWATPSPGAMILVSTQTASASASISWTGLTANNYALIFNAPVTSASVPCYVQYYANGAWVTTGYTWNYYFFTGAALTGTQGNNEAGVDLTGNGNTSFFNQYTYAYGTIHTNMNTTKPQVYMTGCTDKPVNVAGYRPTAFAGVSTGLRIIPQSGTITSGTFSLYSIAS